MDSWFYVPLLLAGARRLHPDTEMQWGQQPDGEEWTHLVNQLRAAPPVPWQQLHTTIYQKKIQHLNANNGQPVPPAEQAAAERIATTGAQTPHGSHVYLSWAVTQVSYPSGYLANIRAGNLTPDSRRASELKGPPTLLLWPSDGGIQANTLYHHNVYNTSSQHEPHQLQTQTQTQKRVTPPLHPKTVPPRQTPLKPPVPQLAIHHPLQQNNHLPPGVPQIESRQNHSSATPAPANNVATNPTHIVPNEYQEAWLSLDDVDLHTTLQQKHVGFQSPPNFIRGRIRQAIRAWKLWMLLPRMLMHRPPNTRQLSKEEWRTRIAHFQAGRWTHLLDAR